MGSRRLVCGKILVVPVKFSSHLLAIVLVIAALVATAADEKRLTVYAPQHSYSVALLDRAGREYVPLLDLLSPLGATRSRVDGDKWRLYFNNTESEFKIGRSKAKVNGKGVRMQAPFMMDETRALVPMHSLAAVLSRLLGTSVDLRAPARRLFIAGVATHFAADLQGSATLVLHFSAPVNPTIATEPGKLRMVFTHDPVVGPSGAQAFKDNTITSASFAERDGTAELTIHATVPLLARFGDQQRTITIAPAPSGNTGPAVAASTTPPETAAAPPHPAPQPSVPVAHPRAAVVIDPGHGGDDRGALLSPSLPEKEVTLAWARRLRAALQQKGISVMLLRDGDTSLTLDQRAALANAARPQVFITLHAGSTGTGVRIYTAHMGESAPRAGSFLPWNSAQAAFLDSSRSLAGSIAAEMRKREIPSGTAPVFLRPLINVAGSAVAIEVMPVTSDVDSLMSAGYQQSVCAAIADGIAASGRFSAARAAP